MPCISCILLTLLVIIYSRKISGFMMPSSHQQYYQEEHFVCKTGKGNYKLCQGVGMINWIKRHMPYLMWNYWIRFYTEAHRINWLVCHDILHCMRNTFIYTSSVSVAIYSGQFMIEVYVYGFLVFLVLHNYLFHSWLYSADCHAWWLLSNPLYPGLWPRAYGCPVRVQATAVSYMYMRQIEYRLPQNLHN